MLQMQNSIIKRGFQIEQASHPRPFTHPYHYRCPRPLFLPVVKIPAGLRADTLRYPHPHRRRVCWSSPGFSCAHLHCDLYCYVEV